MDANNYPLICVHWCHSRLNRRLFALHCLCFVLQPGHGLHEKPYENALVVELGLRGISCQQQRSFNVVYKETKVGEYIPDLIADGMIIIEPKVIDRISDHERGRMINYLRIAGLSVGLILNFRRAKLEWERIVLSDAKPRMDPVSLTGPKQPQ